ncbi:MAG: hypothetical protein ACI9DG_000746 [Oleispira sp.]|jgi:hypothetical protein
MTDVIKGISGENRFLVMTEQDARQIMSSAPNLNFYRCQQMGEFDAVLDSISAQPKIELCHKLKIGLSTYDSFLIEQFKANILHMYFTGASHYTASSNKLAETSESVFYLVPAIYGLEYSGVNFFNLTSNPAASKQYVERFKLEEMKPQQLVHDFYSNAGSMYKNGAPMFPLPKHYENHLVKMLVDGDAIIIEKSKSLFAPFIEMFSSAEAVGGVLQSNKIDNSCQPIEVFIIKCVHYPKTRKFQLDVINTAPNFNGNQHVLQVVAQTDKPETVTIEYDKANCTNGDKECPSIVVDGGSYSGQKITTSPFKLIAKPFQKTEDLSFWDFMQSYFLPDFRDLQPEKYVITTGGCSDISGQKAEVHCFPTFEWSGKIEAGMKHKYNAVGLLEDREFSFGGEIKYVRNGNTTKFGGKSTSTGNKEVTFPKLESMLTSIVSKLDDVKNSKQEAGLNSVGKTISDVKKNTGSEDLIIVEVEPPKISLGGGLKLAESSATGEVGMAGNVTLDLSPLIGLKVETDLLDWLIITFSGGLGAFLLKVKGLAARSKAKIAEIESSGVLTSAVKKDMTKELSDNKGKAIFDAELYVKFIAKGEISAKCEWKKDVDNSWLSVEGDKTASASAKITFKLEAVAKAKAEAFCVKISIGAELHVAGAKSSVEGIGIETTLFATTTENKPALGGNIRFTGMAIYFTSWAEAGIKTMESDDATKKKFKRNNGKPINKKDVYLNEKKTYDHKQVIFEESTWPDTKNPQPLSKAKL